MTKEEAKKAIIDAMELTPGRWPTTKEEIEGLIDFTLEKKFMDSPEARVSFVNAILGTTDRQRLGE